MSKTTSDFESTPIVVGNRPTTYGEMRNHAQSTIQNTNSESVSLAFLVDENLIPGAIKGSMLVILALLDEIERLTNKED